MFRVLMLATACAMVASCAAGDHTATVTTTPDGWVCDATGCYVPKAEQPPRQGLTALPTLR